jgi:hypothetical protein
MIKQLPTAPQNEIYTSGIIQIVKPTIAAFTRIVNSPKVKKMAGNAKIVAIGLMTEFTIEKIRPAATYIQKEF